MSYIRRGDPATERLVAALEDEALRVHIEQGLYPEYAQYLDVVKRAIFLCSSGLFRRRIPVAGDEIDAALLIAILDLESFVIARLRARFN